MQQEPDDILRTSRENSPFRTPEGYLDSLEDRLEQRIRQVGPVKPVRWYGWAAAASVVLVAGVASWLLWFSAPAGDGPENTLASTTEIYTTWEEEDWAYLEWLAAEDEEVSVEESEEQAWADYLLLSDVSEYELYSEP